ncbi:peptide-N4-(N-acetyl-beta-glucosaminyl)asparagine amidase A [Mangifera indica]|uniref:peptide-N4-(N-acetyl-beta- glucosaminyl)asparagine amidase A n=1 Tax=Mangifera indica TaxID=29780 RepID=UPI001CFB1F70|nr:peptide-N4-(N-acetyl-beta-glucosaminyl)asparagine amidase A [Mangifera indica]XP_044508507.1 peptide-N4-(N-acetyl-beta-glucosaminyl)asparagine amidase A [Mangifera indica]
MNTLTLLALLFSVVIPAPLYLSSSVSPVEPYRYRYLKPLRRQCSPQEYIELAHPLPPSDYVTPSCTRTIVNHFFADTINKPPFTVPYSPPSGCPQPWSHIILEFHAKIKGEQYDRIAGLWLGGVELLRTSTAEPTECGIFWKVRKDITRYSCLLTQSNINVTMMLENIVNDVFTGVYHVKVNLLFFKDKDVTGRVPSILSQNNFNSQVGFESDKYYYPPADLILPISNNDGEKEGFWFRVESESDINFKKINFPRNAYRVILELYVSFHGNDEFWYLNPPNSYIEKNNLSTSRGNGFYREVLVTIDGKLVASEIPFPVIFTGGINPLFWEPVVAIGAFNLPSYDLDLTPFLGVVLDGKEHKIGIKVKDAISYWLVNANLHVWLDSELSEVIAKSCEYRYPNLTRRANEAFRFLDGRLYVKGRRRTAYEGWVKSSLGNLTTRVMRQFRFRGFLRFDKNGTHKLVQQRLKVKRQVEVTNERGFLVTYVIINRRYPLNVKTITSPGSEKDQYVLETDVSHFFREQCLIGKTRSTVYNTQISWGWMEVKDHSVLSGEANTEQSYNYRDEFGCYSRSVAVSNGSLISDKPTPCISTF